MFEIKDRYTNRVIYSSDKAASLREAVLEAIATKTNLSYANLSSADLSYANLSSADLSYANLRCANLSYANLSSADLRSADLRSADLRCANLSSADLRCAKGISKFAAQPLHLLMLQTGKIRMFKMVANDYGSPIQDTDRIIYEVGKRYAVHDADTNENQDCGAGLHVANFEWIMTNWRPGFRLLLVEFTANDIACIPKDASGKFRLHRMKVVQELSPSEFGLPELAK